MFGSSAVSAVTTTGSGFHLENLEMHCMPKILRPLLNAVYHWSYTMVICLIFAAGGRWAFESLKKKFSHAARASNLIALEAGVLGGTPA